MARQPAQVAHLGGCDTQDLSCLPHRQTQAHAVLDELGYLVRHLLGQEHGRGPESTDHPCAVALRTGRDLGLAFAHEALDGQEGLDDR